MVDQSSYDILFEPVQIGPVTARNRFYQVPHATNLGYLFPKAAAGYRGMRAEGGWGVVSTGACDIHYTSDHMHHPYERLWDDSDIAVQAEMVEKVHAHGALAACELNHSGINSMPFYNRTPTLGPSWLRNQTGDMPMLSRGMDKQDIRAFRGWHRDAAMRAKKAGFDIVYVYVAHGAQVTRSFLMRDFNDRTDEYGGSLVNRMRLLNELLIDTKEAVGDTCAVALRYSVHDQDVTEKLEEYRGEAMEVVERLAELPDLWDVNLSWPADAPTSRFEPEGFQEPFVSFVKKVTSKPVVGVGRFTSPDTMVSMIRRGVLDLIGAARPSIADPFLPNKVKEGRIEEIRECIGCNACLGSVVAAGPIQCTQNPTAGEEWRRGWHPEKIAPRASSARVLVVGSGPAGLECAAALGRRGYEVALAEKDRELGGRVTQESRLPGLAAWARVRDYRLQILSSLANVEIFRESELQPQDVLDLGYEHVVVATGSEWRRDGIGGMARRGIPGLESAMRYTPDDVIKGADLPSPVLIYDDDHHYMANVMAELTVRQGKEVIFTTPLETVSSWSRYTCDQPAVIGSMLKWGIIPRVGMKLERVENSTAAFRRAYEDKPQLVEFGSILLVTAKLPRDQLYSGLCASEFRDHGVASLTRIGDCLAPGLIATAVFSGHEFARNFEAPEQDIPFARER